MKINQLIGLNKQARHFLLENCISKRAADIMACGFSGYLNGIEVNDKIDLIRENGKWRAIGSIIEYGKIVSLKGDIDCFFLLRSTVI